MKEVRRRRIFSENDYQSFSFCAKDSQLLVGDLQFELLLEDRFTTLTASLGGSPVVLIIFDTVVYWPVVFGAAMETRYATTVSASGAPRTEDTFSNT
jgi:hypothetical protein